MVGLKVSASFKGFLSQGIFSEHHGINLETNKINENKTLNV